MLGVFKHLSVEAPDQGVLHVKLNRPPVNAVHTDMYIEIAALFRDPDALGARVSVIVLSGEGAHFCAGNDLDEFATMSPENGGERMWRVREAFFAIQECPVPVIGAIHGAALGTGLAIAASCDFLIAAPDAKLGLPEADRRRHGRGPSPGETRLRANGAAHVLHGRANFRRGIGSDGRRHLDRARAGTHRQSAGGCNPRSLLQPDGHTVCQEHPKSDRDDGPAHRL